jgi:predicted acylesterase/phospholipase RssA
MTDRAKAFLRGEKLSFKDANALWKDLKKADELSLARAVLARMRHGDHLLDELPAARQVRQELCRQEAMLTSKDPEINSAVRHDLALKILREEFDLDDEALNGDGETLGIAGGIYKRRWNDLDQVKDLTRSAELYARGAGENYGDDAYPHINAAFLDDLLAKAGDNSEERRRRARDMRVRILEKLTANNDNWWNVATRVEALFGLGRYPEATALVRSVKKTQALWELHTTARQLAKLAHLREERPFELAEIRALFAELLPGRGAAMQSAMIGKVGLALSGGGFRASFYHLGVLARLAELDVLRHVEVLSCVSGGSIVGACYWLALRQRLLEAQPLSRADYIELVRRLIAHFQDAVATNLRGSTQPSKARAAWRLLVQGEKGLMDPERAASALEQNFYRALMPEHNAKPILMHDLVFTPADHDAKLAGTDEFHPGKHNWMRAHKVPVLVLNATTVNTGHAWQFTPTWMGESPWAIHEAADSVPRLQWSWYEPEAQWQIGLARAVAASACVPGVFAPLQIDDMYDDIQVQLVDGGVHDNQGTVSLLALDCNVVLVSDACGQLMLEQSPKPGLGGLLSYAQRSMDTLMERVRMANFADLSARQRTGLLRGLMFLHMKAGLDADPIRLRFSQEAYELQRAPLSPSGVRKDLQQQLAQLRTDLDDFTPDESSHLMACGYQMASKAFERDLSHLTELGDHHAAPYGNWAFKAALAEITSTAASTPRRKELLAAFATGSKPVV